MQKLQLILISILFAVISGLPQGYNYNQQSQSHSQLLAQSNNHAHLSNQAFGSLTPFRQNTNSLSLGSIGNSGDGYHYGRPTPPQITKNIYIHTAPEESEEDEPREVIMGSTRKHYKIIFIRAPIQKIPKLSIVPQKQEDRTLIYVLSKKTDASDIQIASEATPTEPSKPEVYFIKYKTPEEAAHAQNQIQAHYDKLGGSTQISDEVIAPIQSVIGTLSSTNQLSSVGLPLNTQHNYLPPRS